MSPTLSSTGDGVQPGEYVVLINKITVIAVNDLSKNHCCCLLYTNLYFIAPVAIYKILHHFYLYPYTNLYFVAPVAIYKILHHFYRYPYTNLYFVVPVDMYKFLHYFYLYSCTNLYFVTPVDCSYVQIFTSSPLYPFTNLYFVAKPYFRVLHDIRF
jgi:hypothetical protein